MPGIHLRQPGFIHSILGHLQKTKQECKNLNKQKTLDISTRMN